jgi:hypothetical protein
MTLDSSKIIYKKCETCLQFKPSHTRIRNHHTKILLPITAGLLAPLIANDSKHVSSHISSHIEKTPKDTKDAGTQTDSDTEEDDKSDKSNDILIEEVEYEIID